MTDKFLLHGEVPQESSPKGFTRQFLSANQGAGCQFRLLRGQRCRPERAQVRKEVRA